MTLAESLKKSDEVRHQIWETIAGPITIKDVRTQLMLEYFSIAIEHHEAIRFSLQMICGAQLWLWFDQSSRSCIKPPGYALRPRINRSKRLRKVSLISPVPG